MPQYWWFTLTVQDATATCTHGVNPEIALLIIVQRYPRCIQHVKPKFHLNTERYQVNARPDNSVTAIFTFS